MTSNSNANMPTGIEDMTGDTVVECWEGISEPTYKEVWALVNEAHRTGSTIHPEGEEWMACGESNLKDAGDTMKNLWSKLSEEAKRNITAAHDIEFS